MNLISLYYYGRTWLIIDDQSLYLYSRKIRVVGDESTKGRTREQNNCSSTLRGELIIAASLLKAKAKILEVFKKH